MIHRRALRLLLPVCLACALATIAGDPVRFTIPTDAPHNRQLEFVLRAPADTSTAPTGILVLFGGRNWPGDKSLRTYQFDDLADRFHLLLLSPSFLDDDYWQPEKWSGQALQQAIHETCQKFGLRNPPLYYYGYSAGGQCANLFYFWRPENVRAVAIHACGVWSEQIAKLPPIAMSPVPMLITCGQEDEGRFQISYTNAQRLRETGYPVLFREYDKSHDLAGLDLARAFFSDILFGRSKPVKVAQDFATKTVPADDPQAMRIDAELCNPFYSDHAAEIWLKR